jgi:ParB-like chromosome segregation protein Spo0J
VNIINDGFEMVSVGALREHELNPRSGDVGAIFESIEANGFYGGIVVQKSSAKILAGNHRFRAAIEAGAEFVPVHWVDCDDDRALRILLADNRTNDVASYDEPALANLLKQLVSESGTLEGTGFDGDALDNLLSDLGESGTKPVEFEASDKIEILVTCKSKRHQNQLLKRFEKEGLECRAK